MTQFVIDASAALSWMLTSQSTPASVTFLDRRGSETAFIAPYVFEWELTNVLMAIERRRLMSASGYEEAIATLDALEIELEPPLPLWRVRELGALARQLQLSLFDAAYLTLAIEHDCILVSRDARLLAVAAREVECIDLGVEKSR